MILVAAAKFVDLHLMDTGQEYANFNHTRLLTWATLEEIWGIKEDQVCHPSQTKTVSQQPAPMCGASSSGFSSSLYPGP